MNKMLMITKYVKSLIKYIESWLGNILAFKYCKGISSSFIHP